MGEGFSGLPKDLCVCETISKESQKIKVYTTRRRFGKIVTVIEGIDERDINLKDLAKVLKAKLACGGTAKDGVIELQGDHKDKIGDVLAAQGFAKGCWHTRCAPH